MTAATTALVIGGGVAGPVAAMALRKAGIEATVHEAHAGPADGLGGTLTLAPNGMDALAVVGADEAVREAGLPMTRTVVADGSGAVIGDMPGLTDLPSLALWRDDLTRVLVKAATEQGVRIEYGKRLVAADEGPDGVTAHFEDGSSATADVLVGADGIRSRVRTLIDPAAPEPRRVPLLNIGGAAEGTVPGADPRAMYFVFGNQGFFGYWVQPDGRTAWFANLPEPRLMSFAEANRTPRGDWLGRLREAFAGDVPAAGLLERSAAGDLCVIGSVESLRRVPRWSGPRTVLVGDAVHAPSPSSGQGASLAAESAVQLARCLRDLPDPASAFAAYERLRRERVEKVIVRGDRTTNTKSVGPVARRMMKLMMPLALKTFMAPERALGPEQRHRIDWDATVTG